MTTRKKPKWLKWMDKYESLLVLAILVLMAAEFTVMVVRP